MDDKLIECVKKAIDESIEHMTTLQKWSSKNIAIAAIKAVSSYKHPESVIYETEQEKNLRLRKLVDSVALNPKPAVIATQNTLCETCGKGTVMHRGTLNQCCECHVKAGNAPADWHPQCMEVFQRTKPPSAAEDRIQRKLEIHKLRTHNHLGSPVCPNHPFQKNAECKTCYLLSTKPREESDS